jgi:hypothetical protein
MDYGVLSISTRAFPIQSQGRDQLPISPLESRGLTLLCNHVRPMHQSVLRPQGRRSSCQRKIEMSGFSQDRNVRFHGLLQG